MSARPTDTDLHLLNIFVGSLVDTDDLYSAAVVCAIAQPLERDAFRRVGLLFAAACVDTVPPELDLVTESRRAVANLADHEPCSGCQFDPEQHSGDPDDAAHCGHCEDWYVTRLDEALAALWGRIAEPTVYAGWLARLGRVGDVLTPLGISA